MSATSFGGSFGLVASGDMKLKNLVMDHLKRVAMDAQFPLIKYIPFIPPSPAGERLYEMIDDIVAKRRADKGEKKKDLLQIFVDTNDANPKEFSHLHLREEMILFM
jgi:cytochrome P450